MLDDLVQTIETLKERIRSYGTFIEDYESRTRAALIDPMLCTLGWDVSDPSLVHVEPRTANRWADYALLDGNRRTVVFVQAKKLAERDALIQQTVDYAVNENRANRTNVRYCALTNGDKWEVHDIIARETVMSVSVIEEDSPKCALKILGLWRTSLMDGVVDLPVAPVVGAGLQQASSTPLPVTYPRPVGDASAPSAPSGDGWTSLTANFEVTHRPPPREMRFPGGPAIAVRYWRGLVVNVALWLHEQGLLTRQNCQIPRGHDRVVFSTDGRHPNGESFKDPVPVEGTGIVLEANLSGMACVRLAKDLLVHFGQRPSQVYLRLPYRST